jgi:hypothetical protein
MGVSWAQNRQKYISLMDMRKYILVDRQPKVEPPLREIILGGEYNGEMDRYTTREEAEKGHRKMLNKVKRDLLAVRLAEGS